MHCASWPDNDHHAAMCGSVYRVGLTAVGVNEFFFRRLPAATGKREAASATNRHLGE
jgi:hypothetical protein